MDSAFRTVFMMLGVRQQFIPNQLDTVFLYQFVREEYGGHTLEEIVLAAKMIAKGELKASDGKPIELYDYFSPAFFGKMMAAYRLWASEIGNKVSQEKYIEECKERYALQPPMQIDWREIIENDYQLYLSDVDASNTYPEGHYCTLVEDGFIQEDFWKKKYNSAKTNLLNDLNRDLVTLQNSRKVKEQDGYAMSQYYTLLNRIKFYSDGDGDADIQLMAKQKVVLAFFKYNKDLNNKNIYIDANDTISE